MNDYSRDNSALQVSETKLDLNAALLSGWFYLEYQPIVMNQTGRVAGLEALLRLKTEYRTIGPGQFIPQAEQDGSIHQIGMWVLEQAAKQAKNLEFRYGKMAPYISVNISVLQMEEPDFAKKVMQILQREGTHPTKLALEVTESVLASNVEHVQHNLETFNRLGISILIDDFGTGYATFISMLRYPFDKIKIDRAFTKNVHQDNTSRELVSGILKIAEALGKEVVVEGVESEKQFWETLRLGSSYTQGYLFAKPTDMESCEMMIRDGLNDRVSAKDKAYYVLYVSKATVTGSDAQAILEQSRLNNMNSNLTGFLVHASGRFMQYLEGEEDEVTTLIDRIRQDKRHEDMRVILSGWLPQRLFPSWSMGYLDMDEGTTQAGRPDSRAVTPFAEWKARTLDLLELSLEPVLCRALFWSLSEQKECSGCLYASNYAPGE